MGTRGPAGGELCIRDRHETSGPGGGKHQLQRLDGRACPKLICKEDHPVLEPPAVLIGHGEDLPVQVLEDQADHEILGLILLGQYDKDGGFLIAKLLRVKGGVKAEDLLHLRVDVYKRQRHR